jgi:phosphoribosylformimino-5-aminoimidazole carboxamide ribotide isomerase
MEVYPAIDLRGGKCVRLRQGDYNQETVFGDDPAEMARRWVAQGASRLHLVDLDGARDGTLANHPAIAAIVAAVDVPCQMGGGVRDEDAIGRLLDLGLSRLVVGTRAIKEPEWFAAMCRQFPHQLALGIDARAGLAATDGWRETSRTPAVELARRFAELPVAAIVYTDIAKDGMMAGPNLAAMEEMARAVEAPVIASGGVTTAQDVANLAGCGLAGCIIGRALYEGSLSLTDALEAAQEKHKSKPKTASGGRQPPDGIGV